MSKKPAKRGRGRPKGSPNKPKMLSDQQLTEAVASKFDQVGLDLEQLALKDGVPPALAQKMGKSESVKEVGYAKSAILTSEVLKIRAFADTENISSLYKCFHMYLSLCFKLNAPVTNGLAYLAVGVNGTTILSWKNGRTRANEPAYKEFAQYVCDTCLAMREQYALEGAINPVLAMFHEKHYDNFSDQVKDDSVPVSPLGDRQDAEALAEKYKDIPLD